MAYPTNPIYKFSKDLDGNNSSLLKEEGSKTLFIPLSAENRHYKEYLEWVDAGNTAEAAS